jgi:hypothetical protein
MYIYHQIIATSNLLYISKKREKGFNENSFFVIIGVLFCNFIFNTHTHTTIQKKRAGLK